MPFSDNAPLRPRARYDLKKRCLHRGYLCPCVLVVLLPFVLVRFVMFYDITVPFRSSLSTSEDIRREELQLYRLPESTRDDVEIPIIYDNHFVRPDGGAWKTHDNGIHDASDPIKTDPSLGRTENERATGRHLPVTKTQTDQDNEDMNLGFPEDNEEDRVVGVVDEVQLREIGERIELIRRWESGGDRNRLNSEDERQSEGQQVTNDQLKAGQGSEEKKASGEGEAKEQLKAADKDEEGAAEERRVSEEIEADEERRIAEEVEAEEKRNAKEEREAAEGNAEEKKVVIQERMDAKEDRERAGEERRAAEEMEVDEERRVADQLEAAEESDTEKEGNPAEVKEAEKERRAATEREAEEETMAAKESVSEEGSVSNEDSKAAQEKDAEEEKKVNEQRDAGGENNGEAEKSDTRKGDEIMSDEQQSKDVQKLDVDEQHSSEADAQKTANDQKGDEWIVKLEEPTEESKNIEEQIQEKENEKHQDSNAEDREDSTIPADQTDGATLSVGACDLFDGDWEYDPEGPLYTNSTCFYIRGDHNCLSNGRPDTDYLNWRWKPRGCDLPRFDAWAFMEAFKGKTIGFLGDSLARNQMQSMLCMLSLVEVPIRLHDDELTTRWLYEQHQVTVVVTWSPYLLKESQEEVMGYEKGQSFLYLDVLDPVWQFMLPDCDIIVLSVGQWYFKPSVYIMHDEAIGCHYCPNLNLTEFSFFQAYSEGLRLALEKLAAEFKGTVILSTFASAHGEHSPAHEGDQCRRERPLKKEEWESSFRGMQQEMRDVVLGEFNRLVNNKSKLNNDLYIEFLDVSTLSLLRADGHPGPFYNANPYEGKNPDELVFNDCLHWCLPGPVDTWNQLLVEIAHKYL